MSFPYFKSTFQMFFSSVYSKFRKHFSKVNLFKQWFDCYYFLPIRFIFFNICYLFVSLFFFWTTKKLDLSDSRQVCIGHWPPHFDRRCFAVVVRIFQLAQVVQLAVRRRHPVARRRRRRAQVVVVRKAEGCRWSHGDGFSPEWIFRQSGNGPVVIGRAVRICFHESCR